MSNLLTQTNVNLDTGVPRQLPHVQIPDLPISTYMEIGEACRDTAGQLAAAGEAGVTVLENICRHYLLNSEHFGRSLAGMQAQGVKMGSAYVPGGPLPAWVTTSPEIMVPSGELGWTSSLSHSLQCLWGCLRTYPQEAVVVAIFVAAVIQQRMNNNRTGNDCKNDEDDDKPPIRGDQVSVSQPVIASYPTAIGDPRPITDPVTSINLALGHLTPPHASDRYQGKKRKATDEVSVTRREAEHVPKKHRTPDSRDGILISPSIKTAVMHKPAPRKKRGRPRKHNIA